MDWPWQKYWLRYSRKIIETIKVTPAAHCEKEVVPTALFTVTLSTSCFKSLSCSESWTRCCSLNLTSYSSYCGLRNLLNSILNTYSWVILLFSNFIKTQFDSASLIIQLMQLRFVESVDNAWHREGKGFNIFLSKDWPSNPRNAVCTDKVSSTIFWLKTV